MPHDHAGRLSRAAEAARRQKLDALVITPSADLVYLLGYAPPPLERLTALVLRPKGAPVLLVPELERQLAQDAGVERYADIASWGETDDPYELARSVAGRARAIGCSDRMWATHLLSLQRTIRDARFVPASSALGGLRAVKDRAELDLLKRAARYADEAFSRIMQTRLETRTERELAANLRELLLDAGHDEVAFTIVGAGPNAASPHHEPTGREVHRGDPVLMDFGGRTGGYCSDITRTVVIGSADDEFRHVYDVVREAQDEAFRVVEPGVPAEEVDRAARRVIEGAGYGERFIHRTGHGIGLEEHEAPYIVEGNSEPLRPGMCFSIEPGIYLPDAFGVRIEDIVTVTPTGARRLNHAPRELEVAR